jgi:hypothetical protein
VRQNYFNARIRFGKFSADFDVVMTRAVKIAVFYTDAFL